MKCKKIILTLGVALSIVFASNFQAFASENVLTTDKYESSFSGSSEIGSPETVVSDVLTFDEITERIAQRNNISISEAEKQIESSFSTGYEKSEGIFNYGIQSISARSGTYRVISSTFDVTSVYRPSLEFYCQTSEWSGSFRAIDKILNIGMNRYSNNRSKQFSGSVYANLEDPNRIYWIVNGDFYDNGTTSVNGGVNIGVGEKSSVDFSVSYSSNHYAYAYKTGYARF